MIIVIILDEDMLFIPVLLTQVFIFTLMKRERMKANLFISPSVCFFFVFCQVLYFVWLE